MGFVRRLTSTDIAPLNLNYLFDNIRNYTLATTVMIAGIWLAGKGAVVPGTPWVDWIFGAHVALCGLILIALHFVHSLRTIVRTPGKDWPAFIVIDNLADWFAGTGLGGVVEIFSLRQAIFSTSHSFKKWATRRNTPK